MRLASCIGTGIELFPLLMRVKDRVDMAANCARDLIHEGRLGTSL